MSEQKVDYSAEEFERMLVKLPKSLKRKVKSICALTGRSVQEVTQEVLAEWAREHENDGREVNSSRK